MLPIKFQSGMFVIVVSSTRNPLFGLISYYYNRGLITRQETIALLYTLLNLTNKLRNKDQSFLLFKNWSIPNIVPKPLHCYTHIHSMRCCRRRRYLHVFLPIKKGTYISFFLIPQSLKIPLIFFSQCFSLNMHNQQ